MNILESIQSDLNDIPGIWEEKNGIHSFEAVIAERKTFFNKKKLTYIAKFRIVEESKEIKFTEMLMESGFGLSSGVGDDEMSSGFGFKTESYNTFANKPREGSITEQSDLFGKKYEYKFEWGMVRKNIEEIAKQNGYEFKYQITSIGL